MKTYLVTHKKTLRTFLFKFSLKGVILEFKANFVMTLAMIDQFKEMFPFSEKEIEKIPKDIFRIDLIDDGLSFTTFWKKYKWPHGNKKQAEKLFNELEDVEQAKAIRYIDTYNNFLKLNNITKAYATTYLNQKRFNNE